MAYRVAIFIGRRRFRGRFSNRVGSVGTVRTTDEYEGYNEERSKDNGPPKGQHRADECLLCLVHSGAR